MTGSQSSRAIDPSAAAVEAPLESGPDGPVAARMRRIRWRARRGLLENDLVLTRFLDGLGRDLTDEEVHGLDVLLDLSDPELLDLILERSEPTGEATCPQARAVLADLRAA